MKIKKQHRRKKFHAHYNRKRMMSKQRDTGPLLCKTIKEEWNPKKSTLKNLSEMGLAIDPNKVVPIPNYKKDQTEKALKILKQNGEHKNSRANNKVNVKNEVCAKLEKEARAARQRNFMLPKKQVDFITYLLDKYGYDYKAMEKDKKNYYQETWKQLRAKIKTFMGIPKQYSEYLRERNLLEIDIDDKQLLSQARQMVADDSE